MRIIHNMLMNRNAPWTRQPLARQNHARRQAVATALKRINLYLPSVLLPTMLVLFVVGCGGGKY